MKHAPAVSRPEGLRYRSSRGARSAALQGCLAALAAATLSAQAIELTPVVSRTPARTIDLPGEIQPFMSVPLMPRVAGYVEHVLVDRGSRVKRGQRLVELSAPELTAAVAQAEARVRAADADRAQAQAELDAAVSTAERTRQAAQTPGAVAGNELVRADKEVEAARARLVAREQSSRAAAADATAQRDLQSYLTVTAPFDAVVTERLVHPGALVGPSTGTPLLVLQQIARLRLVVAVPEQAIAAIDAGTSVEFRVPAREGRVFTGTIARSAHTLDPKTRTMAVELDVTNSDGALAPGMYPTVKWPVHQTQPALLVPRTAVVTTAERTFVIRDRDGRAEWVDVRRGNPDGDLVEVSGPLERTDRVVRRATDEIRPGTSLTGAK
jgi:RND family efflux transporter MFP subunit